MKRLPRWPLAACLLLTVAVSAEEPAPADRLPANDPPIAPLRPRSEAEQDQVAAAALAMRGRVQFQRNDLAGALQSYQRAWRYDSRSTALLRQIVALAVSLQREDEATRYAVLLAEREPRDAELVKQLAMYVGGQEQWDRALGLLAAARRLEAARPPRFARVVLDLEVGRLAFLAGRFAEAAASLEQPLEALEQPERYLLSEDERSQLSESRQLVSRLYGESLLQAGRFEDAARFFAAEHRRQPDAARFALQSARVLAGQGKPREALTRLEPYFDDAREGDGDQPLLLLEQLVGKTAPPGEADRLLLERLQRLQEQHPHHATLLLFLGDRLLQGDRWAEAEPVFRRMAKADDAPVAWRRLAEIARRQGDLGALLKALGSLTLSQEGLDPDDELVEQLVGAGLLGPLAEEARRHRAAGRELPGGSAWALAVVAIADRQFAVADEFFELALQQARPSPAAVLFSWGLEMLLAEQYGRAAGAFRRAIDDRVAPENNAEYYYYLAGALSGADRGDDALRAARKVAALDRDSPVFQAREAWVLYRLGRLDEAIERCREVVEQFADRYETPELRESLREVRLMASGIAAEAEQGSLAEQWLEEVLDEFPEDVHALNDLGYLWADRGKHLQRSLAMVQKAVDAEPDNTAYRDSLGWVFFRLGRFPEALRELETAAAGEDADGVILDHLGDARWATGDLEGARECWTRAAAAFEQSNQPTRRQRAQVKLRHPPPG